tara:strand:- start:341 stop:805 length:465 start_codon:yes stop_codon:yes gene_type:complete
MLEPQTPQQPIISLPDSEADLFSVKISTCFFKVHEKSGGLIGLEEQNGLYAAPSRFLKNGDSIDNVLQSIQEKHISNRESVNNHTEMVLCGWDKSKDTRLSFVYCCYISSLSSTSGLVFLECDKAIQAHENKKITEEQYSIIEKALSGNVSTKQ